MADNDNVFVFIGTYDSTDAAWEDYDAVKELHSRGVIGTYDAAWGMFQERHLTGWTARFTFACARSLLRKVPGQGLP